MVDFVPFPGMASTDNNTQYPANQVMITGNSGTVTASGSMVISGTSGLIGVGTTNPLGPFDANVSVSFRQGFTTQNTAVVSSLYSNTYGYFGQNVTVAQSLSVTGANTSISSSTGALVLSGGLGLAGNVNAGGTRSTFAGFVGIGTGSNAGINSNVLSVYGTGMVYGNIVLQNTAGQAGIFFTDGTFQTTAGGGGSSNYGNSNVASYLSGPVVIGNLTINNSTISTTTATGALIMWGGAGIAGNVNIGGQQNNITGNISVNGTNTSVSSTTGALVTAGGVGIGGNLNVGGTKSTFTNSIGIGTTTGAGMFTGSANAFVWGNVVLANTATTSSGIIFPDGTRQTTAQQPGVSYGLVNTIQLAAASNTFTGDSSQFVYDNTNKRLGIGTSTPAYLFSLYGTDYVLFNNRPGLGARQEITVGNVIGYGSVLGYDPSLSQSIGYLRRGDSSATSPAITWSYVSSNYRVGINAVTQPQNALDIAGAVNIGTGYAGTAVQTNTNGLSVQGSVGIGTFTPNTSTSNVLTLFNSTGGAIELASGGSGGGHGLQGITGGGLKFSNFTGAVNGETWSEAARIDSSGNMGIGSSAPLSSLIVRYLDVRNATSAGVVMTAAQKFSIYSSSSSSMVFADETNSATRMVINTSGNLSIGTTAVSGFVTIQRGGGASTVPEIYSSDGTQATLISSNWAGGSFNPYVTAGDHGIIFHNGSTDTGAFTISPWSTIAKGLRINNTGNVTMANNVNVTGEVTAYFSDERLKDNVTIIGNALEKLNVINGVYYNANEIAAELLHEDITVRRVGLLANEIAKVMPEIVRQAPFDVAPDGSSKSGEDYKTVQYERLVPLLVQAIKEQQQKIEEMEARISTLELDPWP